MTDLLRHSKIILKVFRLSLSRAPPYAPRMTSEQSRPRLNKLPFLVGDGLLLAAAGWLAWHGDTAGSWWLSVLMVACTALGVWLGTLPFLVEYRAELAHAETKTLATTVDQIIGLQRVGEQVTTATGRWQVAQEAADTTVRSAREIAERMTEETRKFTEFMQQTHDAEVRNLRLEVEKLRRVEADWLQVMVRVMDHIYALYLAGVRSGQPELATELAQFQNACRETVRRVGLVPLEFPADTLFDDRVHQVPENAPASTSGRIAQTVATGFTFQGQLLRRALVLRQPSSEGSPASEAAPTLPTAPEAAHDS